MRQSIHFAFIAIAAFSAPAFASEEMPTFETGSPAPGHFAKVIAPEYHGTAVYHGLYLPTDWKKGRTYPVIVEYAGNSWGSICSGKVEDCKMGFYETGGAGFIWIVLPFVNEKEKKNQLTWWGDVDATVKYCMVNVKRTCETFGGDPSAIFLTGFSRGAIACGYIGAHDDAIASQWAGYIAFAHFDAGTFTPRGGRERLSRMKNRPVLIIYGEKDESGKGNSLTGARILKELGATPVVIEIPGLGHSDEWIRKDGPQRRQVRAWLARQVTPVSSELRKAKQCG